MLVTLRSSEGKKKEVQKEIAEKSVLIKNMIDDLGDALAEQPIPLPNVSFHILEKVMEWCEHHKDDPVLPETEDAGSMSTKAKADHTMSPWDEEFCKVDQGTLFELILAANYLDIKPLLDVGCKTVANMIKGKTAEELRKQFNIANDFTKEEEEAVHRENAWCEDAF